MKILSCVTEFILPSYIPQMFQMATWVIHHLFEMCHARKANYMAINLYISLLGLAASRKVNLKIGSIGPSPIATKLNFLLLSPNLSVSRTHSKKKKIPQQRDQFKPLVQCYGSASDS